MQRLRSFLTSWQKKRCTLVILFFFSFHTPLLAQQTNEEIDSDLEEAIDFFDAIAEEDSVQDNELREEPLKEAAEETSSWNFQLANSFANLLAYNTAQPQHRPNFIGFTWLDSQWSMNIMLNYTELFRLYIDTQAHLNLAYRLRGSNNYSDLFLKDNEMDVSFRRFLVVLEPEPWLSFQLGADILSWGRNDLLSVVQRLHAYDQRNPSPLLESSNQLQQPQILSGVRLHYELWQLNAHLLYATAGNLNPLPGSEWVENGNVIPAQYPKNINLAISLDYFGDFFDFSLIYGLFDDPQPYLKELPLSQEQAQKLSLLENRTVTASAGQLTYSRIHLAAMAFSLPVESFVFKGESALSIGNRSYPQIAQPYNRLAVSVGVDYYPTFFIFASESFLTLEIAYQYNFDYKEEREYPYNPLKERWDAALSVHFSFDEKHPFGIDTKIFLFDLFQFDDGGQLNAGIFWQPVDQWLLELGYTHYINGDSPSNKQLSYNSKIYLSSQFSF